MTELLDDLIEQAEALDRNLSLYLDGHPSARVSHARPTYLIAALRKEQEVIEAKAARRAELDALRKSGDAKRAESEEYTQFEIDMAAMRKQRGYEGGHTPAEYRAMVEANRAIPKQSPEEAARVMRNGG